MRKEACPCEKVCWLASRLLESVRKRELELSIFEAEETRTIYGIVGTDYDGKFLFLTRNNFSRYFVVISGGIQAFPVNLLPEYNTLENMYVTKA